MKNNFEELKNELLIKAKKQNACSDQYNRAKNSSNEEELLKVIYDKIAWCIDNEIISNDYFSKFNQELYLKSGIANTGKENLGFMNSGYRNSGTGIAGTVIAGTGIAGLFAPQTTLLCGCLISLANQ